jgi:hypothetical protein
MAAFVPHWSNKYFHVIASNGIVSSSPYIMTASPTASVRVFENHPRRRCRHVTFGALPTLSARDRAIIVLNDHRFWGSFWPFIVRQHAPIVHHGYAARRSALPRERTRPLAQSRLSIE